MLITSTPRDYLLCLRCGFAGWTGFWLEHCPECAAPVPGSGAREIRRPEPRPVAGGAPKARHARKTGRRESAGRS